MRSSLYLCASLLLSLLSACQGFPLGAVGRAHELSPEVRDAVDRARRLALEERFEAAIAALESAASLDPLAIIVHRDLQELQVRALRKDEALSTADQRVAAEPDNAAWLYLRGRLEEEPEQQAAWFERALNADLDFAWARYGLGITALRQNDLSRAAHLLEEALDQERDNPEFILAAADVVRRGGELAEARERTLRAAARYPSDVRFALALVSIELEAADLQAAFRQALRALRADALEPATYGVFLEWLRNDPRRVDLEALDRELVRVSAVLRQQRIPRATAIAFHRLSGQLALARGQHEAALLAYRRARSTGSHLLRDFEAQRTARVQSGLYLEALEVWSEGVPPGLLLHPAQVFRSRWEALRSASIAATDQPSAQHLLTLAVAYRDVGWLEEARLVAARAELLDGSLALATLELCNRIEGFQVAWDDLRAMVTAGYRGTESHSLEDVLGMLQQHAAVVLGADPGPTRIERLSFFASRVDPTLDGQGLGRFLDTFARFAVLGQLMGDPVDVFAMRAIHRRDIEGELLGRPWIGNVVVGEAREISARNEQSGPGIAGAAVHNGYFINLDIVRDWTLEVEELLRIYGTEERSERLFAAAPRPCAPHERRATSESLHVAQKLALRAALRGQKGPLLQRLFELVSVHERGHLADAAEYLPLTRKPFAVLGFLIAAGFSPAAIEARLELRAELCALAAAEEPDLVLSHIVSYAAAGRSNAHAQGFGELLERFIAYLDDHLEEFPTLDAGCNLLQQLHRLDNASLHRVALALAREEGVLREN